MEHPFARDGEIVRRVALFVPAAEAGMAVAHLIPTRHRAIRPRRSRRRPGERKEVHRRRLSPSAGRRTRFRRPSLVGLVALFGLIAACSSAGAIPGQAFPIVANADPAVGNERLLIGLVTPDATSLAAPDLPVEVDLYPPAASEPSETVTATFMWTVPGVRGLYRAEGSFDRPGVWKVAVHADDGSATDAIPFNVAEDHQVPTVGDEAPPAVTPTVDDAPISDISTDPDPDPRFYRLSLDQALASGRPTVIVFATPAFCQTATCGPMLDTVKQVAPEFPDVDFVHVEIYQSLGDGKFDQSRLAAAVKAWNLQSEPWVFVTDSDGIITARLEGSTDEEEIRGALEAVT